MKAVVRKASRAFIRISNTLLLWRWTGLSKKIFQSSCYGRLASVLFRLRGDVPRPNAQVRGDKKLDANCCLYVGVQLLIPPDLVNRSTSPRRGLVRQRGCILTAPSRRMVSPFNM